MASFLGALNKIMRSSKYFPSAAAFRGNIYFAGDGVQLSIFLQLPHLGVTFILLAMVNK